MPAVRDARGRWWFRPEHLEAMIRARRAEAAWELSGEAARKGNRPVSPPVSPGHGEQIADLPKPGEHWPKVLNERFPQQCPPACGSAGTGRRCGAGGVGARR